MAGDRSRKARTCFSRLCVRYDAAHFPEDLVFQETSDRANFQARYIIRHAWTGTDACAAATTYREQLRERYEREAQTLALIDRMEDRGHPPCDAHRVTARRG